MCPTSEICRARQDPESTLHYFVDTDYKYYFKNWYTEMDLMCVPATKVGLMITVYYLAFAAGGVFYPLPEKIGRKKSVMLSVCISLIAQTIIVLNKDLRIRTFCFALMGLS